jgi:hypothetical protein
VDKTAITDPWHYPRPELANQYLQTLQVGLIKSLAIFAQRRMGKTEFLRKDLMPAAEQAGYTVIYVSLWETKDEPEAVLLDAIQQAAEGRGLLPAIRRGLGRPGSKIGIGAHAATVGAQASWEQGTAKEGNLLLELRRWMELLAQKQKPTLLLVDEIQSLADEKRYGALVAALRSALDKHNDKIKAVFTGSSSDGLQRMFQKERAPLFQFSQQIPFPQMDRGFVQHMLRAFTHATQRKLNEEDAWQSFVSLELVPEHFRTMMAAMVQTGSTDIGMALAQVKIAIREPAEFPSRWRSLRPIDQAVLIILATGWRPYTKESRQLIAQILEVATDGITASTIQKSLKRMSAKGIIASIGSREYQIEDRAFSAWIREETAPV